jgi:SanA protein
MKFQKKVSKKKLVVALIIFIGTCIFSYTCNKWIITSTESQIYSDINKIPFRKTGLVLGASRKTTRGTDNLYFKYRIQAAYDLFTNHKIKYLILSGDNHTKGYDEPTDMRDALIEKGIPDTCLFLDYAGFRTFDSMVRSKEVFCEDSITVISQEFHNQRAIFIANKNKINAIGFNAKEVNNNYSFKTRAREILAKVKCVLDIYILYTTPKFLGEKIKIG